MPLHNVAGKKRLRSGRQLKIYDTFSSQYAKVCSLESFRHYIRDKSVARFFCDSKTRAIDRDAIASFQRARNVAPSVNRERGPRFVSDCSCVRNYSGEHTTKKIPSFLRG